MPDTSPAAICWHPVVVIAVAELSTRIFALAEWATKLAPVRLVGVTSAHRAQNIALSFNGQDFLSRQVVDASYLQYVEAFNNFLFAPRRKFYLFSFARDPMNPRPTGSINMSRIKDKVLEITTTPYSNTRNIRVYAISYNLLRIENGLAGLLFNF